MQFFEQKASAQLRCAAAVADAALQQLAWVSSAYETRQVQWPLCDDVCDVTDLSRVWLIRSGSQVHLIVGHPSLCSIDATVGSSFTQFKQIFAIKPGQHCLSYVSICAHYQGVTPLVCSHLGRHPKYHWLFVLVAVKLSSTDNLSAEV